jgi:pimeloyl-ACP methyl ester carboxylesterase
MDVPITRERIDDLVLDHAAAPGPAGPPILYVHGLWGGAWVFEHWLRASATHGHDAWAINLRGHHGSRPVALLAAVGIDEYVRDVADVLAAIGPAVVVGHSLGGLVAQIVAARADVLAAVLVASAPPPGIPLLTWPLLRRLPWYLARMAGPRAFRAREADTCALSLNAVPPAQRRALAARFVADSGRVALQLALGRVTMPPRPRCPMLVVGAARDRLIPARVQRRIAHHYGAEYMEVLDRGHMLPLEPGWPAPLARLLGWIERRGGAREPVAALSAP